MLVMWHFNALSSCETSSSRPSASSDVLAMMHFIPHMRPLKSSNYQRQSTKISTMQKRMILPFHAFFLSFPLLLKTGGFWFSLIDHTLTYTAHAQSEHFGISNRHNRTTRYLRVIRGQHLFYIWSPKQLLAVYMALGGYVLCDIFQHRL